MPCNEVFLSGKLLLTGKLSIRQNKYTQKCSSGMSFASLFYEEKAKPIVKWGRKATGLEHETAGLP